MTRDRMGDFEDGNIPVPGGELVCYLRVQPRDTGAQAEVMQAAWAMVLGSLKAGLAAALDPGSDLAPRPLRPKRR